MIRNLQPEDVTLCVEGGFLFFEEGKLPGGFKPSYFTAKLGALIREGVAHVIGLFNSDGTEIQGALAYMVHEDLFNGDKVATESFWFMLPKFRGRGLLLLNEFERQAGLLGCRRVNMIHLHSLQPEILSELYHRKGFSKIETNYTKHL